MSKIKRIKLPKFGGEVIWAMPERKHSFFRRCSLSIYTTKFEFLTVKVLLPLCHESHSDERINLSIFCTAVHFKKPPQSSAIQDRLKVRKGMLKKCWGNLGKMLKTCSRRILGTLWLVALCEILNSHYWMIKRGFLLKYFFNFRIGWVCSFF